QDAGTYPSAFPAGGLAVHPRTTQPQRERVCPGDKRHAGDPGAQGWYQTHRFQLRSRHLHGGGGCVQHRYGGIPRGADRPELSR
ncbi:unnamed protein product, partial [Ectocarpus sp. 6 AP-2014]